MVSYSLITYETGSSTQLNTIEDQIQSPLSTLEKKKILSLPCSWTRQHVMGSWSRYQDTVNYKSPLNTERGTTLIFNELWLSRPGLCAAWPTIGTEPRLSKELTQTLPLKERLFFKGVISFPVLLQDRLPPPHPPSLCLLTSFPLIPLSDEVEGESETLVKKVQYWCLMCIYELKCIHATIWLTGEFWGIGDED